MLFRANLTTATSGVSFSNGGRSITVAANMTCCYPGVPEAVQLWLPRGHQKSIKIQS